MGTINRYSFSDIFQENPDGSLTPKIKIHVNGIEFGPGVNFGQGVAFGGINFHQYKYFDVAGEVREDGVIDIKGFYTHQ